MKALTAGILLLSSTAGAVQPCAPFLILSDQFANSQMSGMVTLRQFYLSGYPTLDPRFLASAALAATSGGNGGCGNVNNPFFLFPPCTIYSSFKAAIIDESAYVKTNYIDMNRTDFFDVADRYRSMMAPGIPNVMVEKFESMFGNKHQPILYSSGCCGDCNHNGAVSINELITAIGILLCAAFPYPGDCHILEGGAAVATLADCPAVDADADGTMKIHDIFRCMSSFFYGCPAP